MVETDFKIAQDDRINLYVWFFVNEQPGDRDRLLNFLGRATVFDTSPTGVIIPLNIKIIKYAEAKESVILDKTYATAGLSGIAQAQLSRLIDELSIKSGKYRIRIETLKDFPELSDTPVQFWLSYIRAPK